MKPELTGTEKKEIKAKKREWCALCEDSMSRAILSRKFAWDVPNARKYECLPRIYE